MISSAAVPATLSANELSPCDFHGPPSLPVPVTCARVAGSVRVNAEKAKITVSLITRHIRDIGRNGKVTLNRCRARAASPVTVLRTQSRMESVSRHWEGFDGRQQIRDGSAIFLCRQHSWLQRKLHQCWRPT